MYMELSAVCRVVQSPRTCYSPKYTNTHEMRGNAKMRRENLISKLKIEGVLKLWNVKSMADNV